MFSTVFKPSLVIRILANTLVPQLRRVSVEIAFQWLYLAIFKILINFKTIQVYLFCFALFVCLFLRQGLIIQSWLA